MRRLLTCIVFALLVPSAVAGDRVLLVPIARASAGAYGTVWVPELWVHNASAQELRLTACEPCTPLDLTFIGRPRETFAPSLFLANLGSDALLLRVPEELSGSVQASLRLLNLGRNNWGIDVPVVAEHELRTGTSTLFPLPYSDDFRVHLRLYAVDEDASFVVRVFQQRTFEEDLLLRERLVEVRLPPDAHARRLYAGYLFIPDLLLGLTPDADPLLVPPRLRVTVSSEKRYWALASVTTNGSQDVTLITPK